MLFHWPFPGKIVPLCWGYQFFEVDPLDLKSILLWPPLESRFSLKFRYSPWKSSCFYSTPTWNFLYHPQQGVITFFRERPIVIFKQILKTRDNLIFFSENLCLTLFCLIILYLSILHYLPLLQFIFYIFFVNSHQSVVLKKQKHERYVWKKRIF